MDNIENLMLEHPKRFQNTMERVERKIDDLTRRTSNLEASNSAIIQHLGNLAAADAQQQLSADEINRRVERIERRLEIAD